MPIRGPDPTPIDMSTPGRTLPQCPTWTRTNRRTPQSSTKRFGDSHRWYANGELTLLAYGPECHLLRDSNTSGVGGKARPALEMTMRHRPEQQRLTNSLCAGS